MKKTPFAAAAIAANVSLTLAMPAHADSYSVQTQTSSTSQKTSANRLSSFVPRTKDTGQKIDYSIWGYALKSIVVGLGPSLRSASGRPEGFTGTHFNRGHKSRLRMEGSRVAFSFFDEDLTASLTEYREDLERVGTQLDIASLARNEQLAFWLNLHNVAVIEQIARNYPTIQPSRLKIDGVPMDEARFIEVAGIKLSPKDIRTGIVYPNWSDPRVIYGFFRGDIGSPLIQPEEFNTRNLDFLLGDNAQEFVNSLRGVEQRGKTLHVSKIYEEAAAFFFPDFQPDLYAHLATHANYDVVKEIAKTDQIAATLSEPDIADLARGQRQPYIANVTSTNRFDEPVMASTRIPPNIQRYIGERREKVERLERRGQRLWTIRVIPLDLPGQESSVPEID
ncbi:MAG: DUF547 domain-containing protein [Pseudomonadota bacterium]